MAKEYWLNPLESRQLDIHNADVFENLNKSYRIWMPNPMWKYLSDALKKLPIYEWTVYRWEQYTTPKYNNVYWDIKPWDIINNKAFTSTSIDKWIADKFAWMDGWVLKYPAEKNVFITIESKNWKYTLNSAEKEIMFDAWTDYDVISKTDRWNIVELYLKEI